ncbi:MAG: thioredoxin-dependent thiol peroxidase [Rhodospirillaceae bacterium]
MTLDIGHTAPPFDLPASGGQQVSLGALKGKSVALFFYPKALTSGCTKEAEAFRDLHDQFAALNVVVLGASKDPVKKQDQFVEKHALPYPLLADVEGTLCDDYGVWVEKSMYGRKYMGIERATFLIGPDGVIKQVWRKVKVSGHAEAVLKAAQERT